MTPKEIILAKLPKIEREHGVEILLAVESGSRMWGFESPNSDYDVRFVYRRPLAWYLSIRDRRDVIEMPDPMWDFSGWDLRKALFQMQRGNVAFFEWLQSGIVYHERLDFTKRVVELMPRYFNSRTAIYHYLHMANGNYRTYLQADEVLLKKYLYVIRPLVCCHFIYEKNKMPPMEFEKLLGRRPEKYGGLPINDLHRLLEAKKAAPELGRGPKIPALNAWIERSLERFSEIARTTARSDMSPDDLDELFMNMVAP